MKITLPCSHKVVWPLKELLYWIQLFRSTNQKTASRKKQTAYLCWPITDWSEKQTDKWSMCRSPLSVRTEEYKNGKMNFLIQKPQKLRYFLREKEFLVVETYFRQTSWIKITGCEGGVFNSMCCVVADMKINHKLPTPCNNSAFGTIKVSTAHCPGIFSPHLGQLQQY